jgi:hypothetical protein
MQHDRPCAEPLGRIERRDPVAHRRFALPAIG